MRFHLPFYLNGLGPSEALERGGDTRFGPPWRSFSETRATEERVSVFDR